MNWHWRARINVIRRACRLDHATSLIARAAPYFYVTAARRPSCYKIPDRPRVRYHFPPFVTARTPAALARLRDDASALASSVIQCRLRATCDCRHRRALSSLGIWMRIYPPHVVRIRAVNLQGVRHRGFPVRAAGLADTVEHGPRDRFRHSDSAAQPTAGYCSPRRAFLEHQIRPLLKRYWQSCRNGSSLDRYEFAATTVPARKSSLVTPKPVLPLRQEGRVDFRPAANPIRFASTCAGIYQPVERAFCHCARVTQVRHGPWIHMLNPTACKA